MSHFEIGSNPDAGQVVLVTGGAGYVGSRLAPRLLAAGYRVKILDLCLFGEQPLAEVKHHPRLELIRGDIRDRNTLQKHIPGCQSVIHLACVSNDPSFDLDPSLGKSINFDAFPQLVDICRDNGVRRFIYASSSSVYGVKSEENVTEEMKLEPLTDYSRYKALCEEILLKKRTGGFATLILRPATLCGYSPRMRLDLTVNILTSHAWNRRRITVFGGAQMRPNLHIEDMTDLYLRSLEWPQDLIDGRIYNAGAENYTIAAIAGQVKEIVGEDVELAVTPTDDLRSYHISSEKIRRELGFTAARSVKDAIRDVVKAFQNGLIPEPDHARYSNIKTFQAQRLR